MQYATKKNMNQASGTYTANLHISKKFSQSQNFENMSLLIPTSTEDLGYALV
jgi:hypothetical protein